MSSQWAEPGTGSFGIPNLGAKTLHTKSTSFPGAVTIFFGYFKLNYLTKL